MPSANSRPTRLVGDIGGTNTRLALFDPADGTLQAVCAYTNRDFASLEEVISHWLNELPLPAPSTCCLAVAAPPFEDRVTMLNMDWSFSRREIGDRFQFAAIACINDFEGNAYALPHLSDDALVTLRAGAFRGGDGRLAVIGPGTGLGGATLSYCGDRPQANASEPGHMSLSPASELEAAVFQHLRPQGGEVWAEMLLSGPGLLRLYRALAQLQGERADMASAAEISASALNGDCPLASASLHMFCGLLGSICGDYVLATGSYGGAYLAGGILPRMVDFLRASDFQQRFSNKGEMTQQMQEVSLYLITSDRVGLIGAAHAPLPAGE